MGRQDGQQIRLGNAMEPVLVLLVQQFQNITKILLFCFQSTPEITIVFNQQLHNSLLEVVTPNVFLIQ